MTRQQLKAKAKNVFADNYWYCVGAVVVADLLYMMASNFVPFAGYFLLPLTLGLYLYFLGFSNGLKPSFSEIFTKGFDGRYYLRRVGGLLWMALFTFLWSLLFVIPGIVKSYSYALTPYILARYPEIPAKEAIKLSMKVMDGRKFELFVLQLSFLGWNLLTVLTFGLVGIFYAGPYEHMTTVLFYEDVMKQVTDSGEFSYSPVIEM